MPETTEPTKQSLVTRPAVEWKNPAQKKRVLRHCKTKGYTIGAFARIAMVEKMDREEGKA